MKKFFSFLAVVFACISGLSAQTSIPGTLKPVSSAKFRDSSTIGSFYLSGFKMQSGFILGAPDGGLIADCVKGSAEFSPGGEYDSVSFIVGPSVHGASSLKDYSIVSMKADGKIVFDEVIFASDVPRFFTLDIKGVSRLSLTVVDGNVDISFANVKLWKPGQKVSNPNTLYPELPSGKVSLVRDLPYYNSSPGGFMQPILGDRFKTSMSEVRSLKITGKEYESGLAFFIEQALIGTQLGHASFWLDRRFDKLSFIVGPKDSQSSNASVWLVVKGDRKTLYEDCIRQNDFSKQVVLDVKDVEMLTIMTEYRDSDLLGGMTLGVVDLAVYPSGYAAIPSAGIINPNKDRIAALPDVCPLMSNIRPVSVRGMSKADQTLFEGESRHYTFSMGGTRYWEGLILTTGNTLLGDAIDSYAEFDLAGEYASTPDASARDRIWTTTIFWYMPTGNWYSTIPFTVPHRPGIIRFRSINAAA